ncbi:hypothetical protein BWD12_18470 [Leptospira santarosai serovar Bananal]|nr:hypothetical protein BWD11_05945 [Leptospira santarosai serovar Grippotyphosa]ONF76508.1 hypothetical protein BWD12_18470 [Leptospira santarosai serovar Bananal]
MIYAYKSKAESLNFLYCTDIFKKETEMNSNLHFLTKRFRKIGAIFSTIILLCFCCNKKGEYYNLTEALQHPADVRDLDLQNQDGGRHWDNTLTTLPKEIGNLQNLQKLNLNNNPLTTLPKEIGKLQNLQQLFLGGNQFTTLPKEIGNLQNLQKLDLYYNKLTTLPKEIGNLQNLQKLDLYNNQLTTLPKEIGNLQSLESLDLSYNDLTTLPEEIGKLQKLQELDLGDNPSLIDQKEKIQKLLPNVKIHFDLKTE